MGKSKALIAPSSFFFFIFPHKSFTSSEKVPCLSLMTSPLSYIVHYNPLSLLILTGKSCCTAQLWVKTNCVTLYRQQFAREVAAQVKGLSFYPHKLYHLEGQFSVYIHRHIQVTLFFLIFFMRFYSDSQLWLPAWHYQTRLTKYRLAGSYSFWFLQLFQFLFFLF